MLRLVKYAVLALIALALVVIAMANRNPVELTLLPGDADRFLGMPLSVQLPLFLVIFAALLAGIAIGFLWEWARESKHRSAASRRSRTIADLEHEVASLRKDSGKPRDEVLALVDARKTPAPSAVR